jgi:hypothetical protein
MRQYLGAALRDDAPTAVRAAAMQSVCNALRSSNGRVIPAARKLGVTPASVWSWVAKHTDLQAELNRIRREAP